MLLLLEEEEEEEGCGAERCVGMGYDGVGGEEAQTASQAGRQSVSQTGGVSQSDR